MIAGTLAQVMTHFADTCEELDKPIVVFTALIPRSEPFENVRNAVHEIAELHKRYVGELNWKARNESEAELRVSLAVDQSEYDSRYFSKG